MSAPIVSGNSNSKEEMYKSRGIKRDREEDFEEKDPALDDQCPKLDRSRNCPYLDTINRNLLDFDFEKLCSVSLSHLNVYACLVCGKYFQGRGQKSHAYTHSVQIGHHVFINLHTLRFYCLPDNYEVIDSSLDDIKFVLNPTFTLTNIKQLDDNSKLSRAYDGTTYLSGIVGMNNIKANDYCNVILQALSHVTPLRDYFLREENYKNIKRPPGDHMILLVQRFGELLRKLWNPRNFKAHVSPHEMLQAVVLCSKKTYQITEQGDPIAFLSWLLNSLHSTLGGTKKKNGKTIYNSHIGRTFQGYMKIYSRRVLPVYINQAEREALLETDAYRETMTETPFLYLTADLPPAPIFQDEMKQNIIPQVPLFQLLQKFNGSQEKEYKTSKESIVKRFEITKLPPYLIICIKRFNKNLFYVEKNPTIVNFPVKNIDLADVLSKDEEVQRKHPHTSYDLVANIVHDSLGGSDQGEKGTYRVHILHKGTGKWFELQDLHVTEILPQMITLTEAYIQIYELRKDLPQQGETPVV
ncbi:PREDICTED: U4/U6.U5 tri-snRNP-associated protein 2-like [Priapulus caudatus]|uniref:ubiquitinyl hydrolase 1 n=1 Tax=Priapulus caudatus TaxID=37621 RepID=A0ABM1E739_PRICU|nr:PREDICTED: U4/U6.U5 tri-snRNP-associated protein 2-like [Priapulus caudatus]